MATDFHDKNQMHLAPERIPAALTHDISSMVLKTVQATLHKTPSHRIRDVNMPLVVKPITSASPQSDL